MTDRSYSLDDFGCADPREFVDIAYRVLLDRTPTAAERERMLEIVLNGGARTYALGQLRYGREGRARGIAVAGLRSRYLAQRLFRIPVIGKVVEGIGAMLRLPRTLRYFRGAVETSAVHHALLGQRQRADNAAALRRASDGEQRLAAAEGSLADLQRRADEADRRTFGLERALADVTNAGEELARRVADSQRQLEALAATQQQGAADVQKALQALAESAQATRARLDAMHPPPLDATMTVAGEPLAALAKARAGIAADASLESLSPDARYAMFETVFYDSRAVAAKQRVYIDHLDLGLAAQAPFLDLGCGRGEFMHILRETGLMAIGVDINGDVVRRLQSEGFTVIEQDLLAFLESDTRMFCGASVLQVAEHLGAPQIERMLALVSRRLLPGAPLIVETPNPLSPFALGVFHTDPTHIAPIPPERMRYSIEAAGFEQAVTLYQAKIPADQYAGPDPRAYYADYAIIAKRSAR